MQWSCLAFGNSIRTADLLKAISLVTINSLGFASFDSDILGASLIPAFNILKSGGQYVADSLVELSCPISQQSMRSQKGHR